MEFVYVIKRMDLFDLEFPHGFHTGQEEGILSKYLERIRNNGFFMERRFCETDSGFKQIIPYAIVEHDQKILLLKRTANQGEARLHNKLSIGVGGHINPIDDAVDILMKGCLREINEELVITESFEPLPIGIINDESNPVGSVHFGLVFLVRLKAGQVKVNETSMMTAEFVGIEELNGLATDMNSNFESWSQLIVPSMDSILS